VREGEAEALGILSHVSPAGFDMLDRRNPTARNRGGGLSQQLFAVEGAEIDWKAQLCNRRFTPVSEACQLRTQAHVKMSEFGSAVS
jgi:hypothetical protein